MSHLVTSLLFQMKVAGLPTPMQEVRFAQPRRWRFDLAFIPPLPKLAIEVEGGTWIYGRHSRGAGMRKDAEKYAEAALLGWMVLRVTGDMVQDGSALGLIERALKVGGEQRA